MARSRFNKELQWLGETLGIDLKTLGANGHLSGAIFGRITDLVEALLDRLEQGDEIRFIADFTDGTVTVTKGQTVTFERLDNMEPVRPWQVVLSTEDEQEFRVEMWEFVKVCRLKGH